MYIIYYSNRSYMQNIVRGCDIAEPARAISDPRTQKSGPIFCTQPGPVRILYSIMVTSLIQTNYYYNNSFTTYVFAHWALNPHALQFVEREHQN